MNTTLTLLIKYKYLILIPLAIPLGPEVAMPASFLASLGYFNVYAVYCIVVFGDVIGDGLWYWGARIGRARFMDKIVHLGITHARVEKAESQLRSHFYKTMIVGKATNIVMLPIIIACGLLRIEYRKFFFTALCLDILKDLLFTLLGYYFGAYYSSIISKTHNFYLEATFILGGAVLLYVGIVYIRKSFSKAHGT